MSSHERHGAHGPVRKRSLSSYLSKVSSRKNDLKDKSDKRRQDKIVTTDLRTADDNSKDNLKLNNKDVINEEYCKNVNTGSKKSRSIMPMTTTTTTDMDMKIEQAELENGLHIEKTGDSQDDRSAAVKNNVSENRELQIQESTKQDYGEDLAEPIIDMKQEVITEAKVDDSHKQTVDYNGGSDALASSIPDISAESEVPSGSEVKQMLEELEVSSKQHSKRSQNDTAEGVEDEDEQDEEEESALSEVDSDAPTEPASPPKPRLGRLIRGDQIVSLSSRQASPTNLQHDSDSELSDLADLKPVPISSSILQGESSPIKPHVIRNSSPRKSSSRTDSPTAAQTPKPSSTNWSKKLKHIAVSKVAKPKKGVHRDAGGRTKLQIACDKGKYELAKTLITEGYDVNDQDNAGNSPLHEAALNGHLNIVKLLILHGANINLQSYEMFKDTPLIDASANGHLEVVEELLKNGADPTIVNAKGLTAIESIEEDSDLEEEEVQIVRKIKSLLRKSARKYRQYEGDGKAEKQRSKNSDGPSDDEDVSPNNTNFEDDFYWTDITSKVGKDKLFRASKEGKLAYVGAYLENGGHADFKAFMECVKFGHEDIASLFLAFGAPVNGSTKDGVTSLMAAVGRGHLGTVKLLLKAGADPTVRAKNGHSILYYAKHSPLGITDDEEISTIKEAIRNKQGYVSEREEEEKEDVSQKVHESVNRTIISSEPISHIKGEATSKGVTSDTKTEVQYEPGASKKPSSNGLPNSDHEDGNQSNVTVPKRRKTESPYPMSLLHDDKQKNSQADRYRLESPVKLKRSASTVSVGSDQSESNTKKSKFESGSETPVPMEHQETAEESEARLKREEQYRLKRLENKRKKEQEFLEKLANDERKREEERERLEREKKKLLEQEELKKNKKEKELRDQEEIDRRVAIRIAYPLGLKLIEFGNKDDYERFLPAFYIVQDGTKYVLDVQISVILKDPDFSKNAANRIPISPNNMSQLWNLYKFIFLYGGHGSGKYLLDLKSLSFENLVAFEKQEYEKFCKLAIYWVPYEEIQWPDAHIYAAVNSNLRELQLLDVPSLPSSSKPVSQSEDFRNTRPPFTPAKFRNRSVMTIWLSGNNTLW